MCQFVRLVKGINYIQEVQEFTRSAQLSNTHTAPPMNIVDAMETAPVRLALEMGVDAGSIRNKTQQQILLTGSPYSTVDDLLKALFDERENEEVNTQADHIHISPGAVSTGTSITPSVENVANSNVIECSDIARNQTVNGINEHRDGATEVVNNIEISSSDVQYVNDNTPTKETCTELENEGGSSCSKSNQILATNSLSLEEENRKLKDARLCKVCLDEEVGVVYLPCGHLGMYTYKKKLLKTQKCCYVSKFSDRLKSKKWRLIGKRKQGFFKK